MKNKRKFWTNLGGIFIGVMFFSGVEVWSNHHWLEKEIFPFAQFSENGLLLASHNYQKRRKKKKDHLTVFDVEAGQVVSLFKSKLSRYSYRPLGVVLSANNQLLAKVVHRGEGEFFLTVTDLKKNKVIQHFETYDLNLLVDPLKKKKSWVRLRALALSPDGTLLAVSRATNQIDVLNLKTKKVQTLKQNWGQSAVVAQFSEDSALLMIRAYRGDIQIWDVKHQKLVQDLNTHDEKGGDTIQAVAFSPDGRFFVLARQAKPTMIWEIKQQADGAFLIGQPLRLKGELGQTTSLAFSKDSNTLLMGKEKGDIAVFDMVAGRVSKRLKAHKKAVIALYLSAENKTMHSFGKDNVINRWDFQTKKRVQTQNANALSWRVWFSELWAQLIKKTSVFIGIMIGYWLGILRKEAKTREPTKKKWEMTKQEELDYWDPPEKK